MRLSTPPYHHHHHHRPTASPQSPLHTHPCHITATEQITNAPALFLADRVTIILRLLRKTLGAPDDARFDLTLEWTIWPRISRLSLCFRAPALNPRQRRRLFLLHRDYRISRSNHLPLCSA